jgi:plasmid stabilization system protein ParE
MSFRVVVTDRAAQELFDFAQWWSDHHSREQAERWHAGLITALASLAENPDRHAVSRENGRFSFVIRQLNYSVTGRSTHRAVFTVQADAVIVLTIRHLAQSDLRPRDLI